MNWKKLILPPVAIYAVIFLFISALVGAKIDTAQAWIIVVDFVVLLVGLYLATRFAAPKDMKQGFVYGLVWAVIFFVLDLVLTVPFTGWVYFASWQSYVYYGLVILVPTLLPKKKFR